VKNFKIILSIFIFLCLFYLHEKYTTIGIVVIGLAFIALILYYIWLSYEPWEEITYNTRKTKLIAIEPPDEEFNETTTMKIILQDIEDNRLYDFNIQRFSTPTLGAIFHVQVNQTNENHYRLYNSSIDIDTRTAGRYAGVIMIIFIIFVLYNFIKNNF
jgi:hypothetical protein